MIKKNKKTLKSPKISAKTLTGILLKTQKPLTVQELREELELPPGSEALCKKILDKLVAEKTLTLDKKRYSAVKPQILIIGTLRLHSRGFGFVQPLTITRGIKEVFIPKPFTNFAIDGDQVQVEVSEESLDERNEKGPDGKVTAIIKRGRTHVGGIVLEKAKAGTFLMHCPLLGQARPVSIKSKKELVAGDRVVLKIVQWGDEDKATKAEIAEYLGHISDPSIDNKAAIKEYNLVEEFSKQAIEQVKKYGESVSKASLRQREDFTKQEIFTIDPTTAKDFDDALSVTKENGGYRLGVHIADASYYVPVNSTLDQEALERGNSTYFPRYCLPMLPKELSENLCSLRAGVIRLTLSVIMDFDAQGNLLSSRVTRSYIKSQKRFTYAEAKKVLDGKIKSKHAQTLHLMVELCHLLKKKRAERGSIDFTLPEFVIEIDEKGAPIGTKIIEYDITHQLVEEFMLKANEIVAKYLEDKGQPVVFRVHEEPSDENIEEFYAFSRKLGFPLPLKPDHTDIQDLFQKAKKTAAGPQLSVSFIRSMKLAAYSIENLGHFGLALEHYCHFTSPIRRYSDLIIHRLVVNEIAKDANLEKIALRCSDQERVSFKAESSVKMLKKLRLLDKWIQEDSSKVYEGVVTKIKPFGLFFEIPTLALEGFLHISELDNDYFIYNGEALTLVGKSSGKIYQWGDLISVRPEGVNLALLESSWALTTARKKKIKK